ncbi:TPA: tRNA (N(6)-L-threonylcarbamoyladenosine(37)-C(2))-methylthiotransferase [archaeon]|nr:tRNA (N(6)-L-threonylcarbamoyladenosine(37)-C(2))-methylthiotransferase [Candidatus Naiadarchaeales archaeon SRR2090159.bin1288]
MKSVYIETYGCSANEADSQIMAGILKKDGYSISDSIEKSDVIVLNTCFVKNPTEHRINTRLNEITKKFPNKKIVIGGCYSEAAPQLIQKYAPDASLLGPRTLDKISEAVGTEQKLILLGKEKVEKTSLIKLRANPLIDIIQANDGCLSNCSFCGTKLARGNLHSYPIGQIVRNVESAVKDGCKEIWLTSQDMGAYGADFGRNLPYLLQEACKVEGDFKIRVGMANPVHVIKFADELIKAYKNEKVYKFLHLPIQSGNNEILSRMARGNTIEQFKEIISKFRKVFPELYLTTDIIVGFPTETEEQFQDTLKLIEECKLDFANISRYGARPGTKAAEMEQISEKVKGERSGRMAVAMKKIALERNKKWLGWKGKILVDEEGQREGTCIGRNYAYKPIVVETKENLIGKEVFVEIEKASPLSLKAKIV